MEDFKKFTTYDESKRTTIASSTTMDTQISRGNLSAYPSHGNDGMTIREVFAKEAMLAVMSEAQEMRIASFWDWVKSLMVIYLHFNFLHVKYVKVSGAYDEAAKRAFEYADKMVAESEKYYKH